MGDKFETFYIVLREDIQSLPTVRHPTESQARNEAERLCRKHGKPFVVLQAIARVEVGQFPVRWIDAGDDTETDG